MNAPRGNPGRVSAFFSITSMLASNKIVVTDTGTTVLINIPTSQILSKGPFDSKEYHMIFGGLNPIETFHI